MSDDTKDIAPGADALDDVRTDAELVPPLERVLRLVREYDYVPPSDIGTPCTHDRLVLNDEWMAVECAECGMRIEAFAVLRKHAKYFETLLREREGLIDAHKQLVVRELKLLMDRKGCPPELRHEARKLLAWGRWKHHDHAVLADLRKRMAAAVADAGQRRKRGAR